VNKIVEMFRGPRYNKSF